MTRNKSTQYQKEEEDQGGERKKNAFHLRRSK